MNINCVNLKNGLCGICKEKCEDFKELYTISQEEYDRFPKWEDDHPEFKHRSRGMDFTDFNSKRI